MEQINDRGRRRLGLGLSTFAFETIFCFGGQIGQRGGCNCAKQRLALPWAIELCSGLLGVKKGTKSQSGQGAEQSERG